MTSWCTPNNGNKTVGISITFNEECLKDAKQKWQRVFQRHRCHNLTLEFRQWFLNPLLGRPFGTVRYRSIWVEEMNNGGGGVSLLISLTPRASLTSSPKPVTKSDKVHGCYSQLGKGEKRTLRQKGAKSTGNGFSSCKAKRHQGRKKKTEHPLVLMLPSGSFIVASPVLLMFFTDSSKILSFLEWASSKQ